MNLRDKIEQWLGRGLWIFGLTIGVALYLIHQVTGVSPIGGYSDTVFFFFAIIAISLFLSLVTIKW